MSIEGHLESVELLGAHQLAKLHVGPTEHLVARVHNATRLQEASKYAVGLNANDIHLFDASSGTRINSSSMEERIMLRSRRAVGRGVLATLAVALAMSVATSANADDKVKTTLLYPIAVGGPLEAVINGLVAGFETANPTIDVEAVYAGGYRTSKWPRALPSPVAMRLPSP